MEDNSPDKQTNNKGIGYGRPPEGKPWKPGQSGNPGGRPPKDLSITSLVKDVLGQDSGYGKTNAQLIAEVLVDLAKNKLSQDNLAALKEVLNRVDGKVADKIEGTDIPVTIVLKRAEDRDATE